MKRPTKIAFLAASVLLVFAVPAQAATVPVAIGDNFFSPTTKAVNRGDKVSWKNGGFDGHNTTGDSPLSLWGSTTFGHNGSFLSPALTAAGTYPYHCTIHGFEGMKAKIQVPLTLTKSARKITLTLSSAAADATHKFVVQQKTGTTFKTIATVTTPTFVFNAPGAGAFTFRSALQKNGTTAPATFFSLPTSITVS